MQLVTAAALLAAAPLAAETPRDSDAELGLRCAAWASVQGGQAEDEEKASAFQMVFGYFVGLYKGASGKDIGGAELTDTIVAEFDNPAWAADCTAEQARIGLHLEMVGADMQAAGALLEAEEAAAAE